MRSLWANSASSQYAQRLSLRRVAASHKEMQALLRERLPASILDKLSPAVLNTLAAQGFNRRQALLRLTALQAEQLFLPQGLGEALLKHWGLVQARAPCTLAANVYASPTSRGVLQIGNGNTAPTGWLRTPLWAHHLILRSSSRRPKWKS